LKAVLDENFPSALARALNELAKPFGDEVIHTLDVVPKKTPDTELFLKLKELGVRAHITQDYHRKQIERKVIAECGLVVFSMKSAWSNEKFWPKATNLVRWWPAIRAQAEFVKPPAAFHVPWKFSGKGQFEVIEL
jgi:hypothetical protein